MKLKDKEKLNNPLKSRQILSSISSMVFHTVQWNTEKDVELQLLVLLKIVFLLELDHQEEVHHVQVAPPTPALEGEAVARQQDRTEPHCNSQ